FLHGGQQQPDQDGDDRYHHQQLDQREAATGTLAPAVPREENFHHPSAPRKKDEQTKCTSSTPCLPQAVQAASANSRDSVSHRIFIAWETVKKKFHPAGRFVG